VSSAKRAGCTPVAWGVSFIYILNSVGDRTEPCGTSAFIILDVDISPSTETENVLSERKELMSMIKPAEKLILNNYILSHCAMLYQMFVVILGNVLLRYHEHEIN
jgi:hypothetical protein